MKAVRNARLPDLSQTLTEALQACTSTSRLDVYWFFAGNRGIESLWIPYRTPIYPQPFYNPYITRMQPLYNPYIMQIYSIALFNAQPPGQLRVCRTEGSGTWTCLSVWGSKVTHHQGSTYIPNTYTGP